MIRCSLVPRPIRMGLGTRLDMTQLHTVTGGDIPHDLDHTHGPSQPAHSEPDSQWCATIRFSHLPCATVKGKLCMNGREEREEER